MVQLLDRFEHEGPNGTHSCLVLEPLGPSLHSIAEAHRSNRLPGRDSWEASRQMISALAYIHQNNITHGSQFQST